MVRKLKAAPVGSVVVVLSAVPAGPGTGAASREPDSEASFIGADEESSW